MMRKSRSPDFSIQIYIVYIHICYRSFYDPYILFRSFWAWFPGKVSYRQLTGMLYPSVAAFVKQFVVLFFISVPNFLLKDVIGRWNGSSDRLHTAERSLSYRHRSQVI